MMLDRPGKAPAATRQHNGTAPDNRPAALRLRGPTEDRTVGRVRRQPLSGERPPRLYRLLMMGKARGQRQPAQQNQQAHQHHQQPETALTGLRHHC